MRALLVAAVLAQVPVDLPAQLGHLRVLSSQTTDRGIELSLEYDNDTGATLKSATIECTVLDHRDAVVNDETKVIGGDTGIAPGQTVAVAMIVPDRVSRAHHAECVVTKVRKGEVRASAPTPTTKDEATTMDEAVETPAAAKPENACCVKCRAGEKACGDLCVPMNQRCRRTPGCACN
ncbi:MAG: hypothetical protein JNG84_02940 [Archangium sp.]|nr:hypothetical protein [Archangium sp.]